MLNRLLLFTAGGVVATGLVLSCGCREAESGTADRTSPPSEARAAGKAGSQQALVQPMSAALAEKDSPPVLTPTSIADASVFPNAEPGADSTRTGDTLRAVVLPGSDALADLSAADNFLPTNRMDEVESMLVDMWSRIETLTCTVTGRMDITKGQKQITQGEGSYDYRNTDGRIQIRLRLLNSLSVQVNPEKGVLTGQKILKIYDGEFLYELQEMHAGAVAHKKRARPGDVQFLGGEPLLRQIYRYDDVRLLGDQVMGQEVMYVYQTSKDGGKIRADYYIHQRTGLLHILVVEDDNRGFKSKTSFNAFYINGFIPKDRFDFKVPEGVEIKDLTQSVPGDAAPKATP